MGRMKPETETMFITGFCHCGCGNPYKRYFVHGHNDLTGGNFPHLTGKDSPKYKHGMGSISKLGYCTKPDPNGGWFYIHRNVVESVLGKSLPLKSVIHHVDENPMNNKNDNLVVCENQLYHIFLHQRLRALRASGHADWRRCRYCGKHDDPVNLPMKDGNMVSHKGCGPEYRRNLKLNKKLKGEQYENRNL
jgi:hypothetical protein